MGQAREDSRRHVRHPIHHPAELLQDDRRGPGCTIEDFSLTGMGVVVKREDAARRPVPRGLRHDGVVTIAFELPEDGRPVRARARLKHVQRVGETIRLGLSFRQTHPVVMDCLLRKSLMAQVNALAADMPAELALEEEPAPAILAATTASTPEAADDDGLDLAQLVPALCGQFFDIARSRLMDRVQRGGDDAHEFLIGMVALQGEEPRLPDYLGSTPEPTVDAIERRFDKTLSSMTVSQRVRDTLAQAFAEVLAEQTGDAAGDREAPVRPSGAQGDSARRSKRTVSSTGKRVTGPDFPSG